MTRRLATVIVSVVIATLLLAGAGTLLLSAAAPAAPRSNELRAQAEQMADNIGEVLEIDDRRRAASKRQAAAEPPAAAGRMRQVDRASTTSRC